MKAIRDGTPLTDKQRDALAAAGLLPPELASVAGPSNSSTPPPPYEPPVEPAPTGVYSERPPGQYTEMLPDPEIVIHKRSKWAVWLGKFLTRLPFINPEPESDVNQLEQV